MLPRIQCLAIEPDEPFRAALRPPMGVESTADTLPIARIVADPFHSHDARQGPRSSGHRRDTSWRGRSGWWRKAGPRPGLPMEKCLDVGERLADRLAAPGFGELVSSVDEVREEQSAHLTRIEPPDDLGHDQPF